MVSRLNRKFRRGRKHLWNSEREGGVKESGIPNAWGGGGLEHFGISECMGR